MDFAITEEHRMMVDSVRQFREKELMPLEKEFLIKGKLDIEVRHGLETCRESGVRQIACVDPVAPHALDERRVAGPEPRGMTGACAVRTRSNASSACQRRWSRISTPPASTA